MPPNKTEAKRAEIITRTTHLFALHGPEGLSMRSLSEDCGVALSVFYHYFKDKDTLLRAMFDYNNSDLGRKRALLKEPDTAREMLRQRIAFQIDNAEAIVAVLKYYLSCRDTFAKQGKGYVPPKTTQHIEEVLEKGIRTGEFVVEDVADEAGVITHAINGFLLEYYPHTPKGKEKKELIERIEKFLLKALLPR